MTRDEIFGLMKEIKSTEDRMNSLIELLEENAQDISLDDKELLNYFYWETNIPMKNIAKGLGIPVSTINKYVDKNTTIEVKLECGHTMIFPITSKYNKSPKAPKRCVACDAKHQDELELKMEKHHEQFIKGHREYVLLLQELKSMPYTEYLKTDHWKSVRNRALRKAWYKCSLCGNTSELHVHHNNYENRGCEKDSDLIVLCKNCHEKHHENI
jgi:5-methylcytosine-specific restriction endonuclease McrA